MLRAANVLLELEPALIAYANKVDYLRLIAGIQLDEAVNNAFYAADGTADDESMSHVSKALAASYAGDQERWFLEPIQEHQLLQK